jgi:hypothetical protein
VTAKSELEEKFLALWTYLHGVPLAREYRFDAVRKYRLDFYHAPTRTGIEIEGGTGHYGKSRHSSPQGYRDDCEKYNLATMQGITILRLTSAMINPPYLQILVAFLNKRVYEVERTHDDG